jgi:hypothetical protein
LENKGLSNEGSVYISDLFRILIFFSILVSAIFMPTPFIRYMHLSNICEVIVDSIQRHGVIDDSTYELLEKLSKLYNVNPEMTVSGNLQTYGSDIRVQLNDEFEVSLKDTVELFVILPKLSNRLSVELPIEKTILGRGRYYWRD